MEIQVNANWCTGKFSSENTTVSSSRKRFSAHCDRMGQMDRTQGRVLKKVSVPYPPHLVYKGVDAESGECELVHREVLL